MPQVRWPHLGPVGSAILLGLSAGLLGGSFGPLLTIPGMIIGLVLGDWLDQRVEKD